MGHTDSVADDAHNQTLSEQRAKAVADYLTSKLPSLNVQSSGKGESEPVASETNEDGSVNEAGKAANRHVDVRWGGCCDDANLGRPAVLGLRLRIRVDYAAHRDHMIAAGQARRAPAMR